ncbi:MAG TPA: hypothetical protein VME70_11165, partial [Mycobacteriales bacterium]|nr:hypothetical protein [Mycobacteriales bacterium]
TATNAVGTGAATAPTHPVMPTIPTTLATSVKSSTAIGGAIPLTATLQRADTHAALPNRRVLVFRREAPSDRWVQVRKLRTNSDGGVSTVLRPKRNAELEAVFPGTANIARSSAFKNYVVRPGVRASLSASAVRSGTRVTIRGSASPFSAGQRVLREGYFDGGWHVWQRSRIGRHGHYSFAFRPTLKTVDVYRIVVAATVRHGSGHSRTLRLVVG